MKYIKTIIWVIFGLLAQETMAQNKLAHKAQQYFNDQSYVEAIDTYHKILAKGDTTQSVIRNLADAYLKISQYEKAAYWYAKNWETQQAGLKPAYAYRYALCLKSLGKYHKADSIMHWFAQKVGEQDLRAKNILKSKDYRQQIDQKKAHFKVVRLSQNSNTLDFAPVLLNNTLVFSSNREIYTNQKEKPHQYRSRALSLFSFESGTQEESQLFDKNLDTKFNESSSCFSKDGSTLYLTKNNNKGRKFKRGKAGFSRLKIYRSKRKEGSWGKLEELPFNSDDYSTAHPNLSVDGKTLYFASDRPGGYGETDIYSVAVHQDGSFGAPINLGPVINTEGRETFPAAGENGILFFASDGHPGLGGMDIFMVDVNQPKKDCVVNLGGSINSPFDDLGITFDDSYEKGYLASDRNRETQMDIYSVQKMVADAFTINCKETLTVKPDKARQGADANNAMHWDASSKRIINDQQKGQLTAAMDTKNTDTNAAMAKATIVVNVDGVKVAPVLFTFNSAQLTNVAKKRLLKVASFMRNNPLVNLKLLGHTDSTGPSSYNMILSKQRAVSVLEFLVHQGISKNRLAAIGMGESQPRTDCGDTPCPASQQRRVVYLPEN